MDDSKEAKTELSADGLLSEPWAPVLIDFHYDLHSYRIFIFRKPGKLDIVKFKNTMEINKQTINDDRNCPNITDTQIYHDINPEWNKIRVPIAISIVVFIMSLYICFSRWRNELKMKKRKQKYQQEDDFSSDFEEEEDDEKQNT